LAHRENAAKPGAHILFVLSLARHDDADPAEQVFAASGHMQSKKSLHALSNEFNSVAQLLCEH
jgi:hypothetical protein